VAQATQIVSHWNTMIEGLQVSPKEFFSAVEQEIERRQTPETKFSRIDWREGGLMSAKREYLRVRRKDLAFDVCGAPFGSGFFVSWWLGEVPSGILAVLARIPGLSLAVYWYLRIFKTETYYKYDTASMFQSLVHASVLSVIDDFTTAKGLRALADTERTPQIRDFFG